MIGIDFVVTARPLLTKLEDKLPALDYLQKLVLLDIYENHHTQDDLSGRVDNMSPKQWVEKEPQQVGVKSLLTLAYEEDITADTFDLLDDLTAKQAIDFGLITRSGQLNLLIEPVGQTA